jgi:Uma2 family endonuclease
MVAPDKSRLYTVDEFEEFLANADGLFELINGEIVEKVTTEEHSLVVGDLYMALRTFVDQHDLGRVAFEVRRRVPGDQYNARQPDLEFTRKERLLPIVRKGAVPQMADLAVEVKSPDDTMPELREKAAYYLANGTRLVWLVLPKKRQVIVITPDSEETLTEDDTLNGGDVVPGFTLPVRDIFRV